MKITFRPYQPSDKSQLITGIEDCQDYFISQDTVGWLQRKKDYGRKYADYLLREKRKHNGQLILAMDGERLAGFIFGATARFTKFKKLYFQPAKIGWIYLLFVYPRYREQKVGTGLMDHMEKYFRQQKCTLVRLEAEGDIPRLEKFYGQRQFTTWLISMVKKI